MCYNVMYTANIFRAAQKIREKAKKNANRLLKLEWMASAILRYYLHVRYLLIREIFNCAGGDMVLPIFNEYIFKERFDLHWQGPHKIKQEYLTKSPFNKDMEGKMGKRFSLSFDESN